MKTLRLLTTSLLIAVCAGFSSCGDEELEEFQLDEMYSTGDSFSTYGLNIKDYECRGSFYFGNINHFSGLKNNHLWISSYDRTTKEKLWEWTDSRTFDKKRTVHVGYGEYKDIEISSITTYGACAKNNIFVASVGYGGESYGEYNILFKTATGNLKEIRNEYPAYITDWYKESVFVGNCCYNDLGDTIYVSQVNNGAVSGTPISYEEAIMISDYQQQLTASRINYKTYKSVWNTEYRLPFEIFSDTKRECTLLDNSTNIWKYKLDLLYYDGTKKDYTFYLNIENGTISETQNASPLVGSWIYITDEGYKEIITFYSDNTGRWESVNIHGNTSNSDPFTYTMDDKEDKFIIDFGDNSPETYYYNISDNKMKLMYEDGHVELYTKQ
ncbi:hypothetical protein KSY44_11960 [Bacteroides eggerthii]|jgi:hypothetical protein|uniref:hypothetical protein n=1 Tax=Bacteroides eggerthii TaxID=28111 RepID=UPI001C37C497|nr:hypothetical protein [Bacteroides eggerthii]MBV3844448.1 hypothetical protein [Bacteroides eggerthii]MBV3847516.1 hypothetical protein [Bacteroides eggerthii]MBV3885693.1 hypothetical protein [Bacteroides eggerthii]MBV3892644.1 hypothetical protein [Bacteroides eggerthii]MBV3903802.1 hypothetical protein [Bacteroides eggerthii]